MIDNVMNSKELPEWFTDLLILRATDGLDADQQKQFDQFVEEHPDRDQIEREAERFELTAAALDLGLENLISEKPQDSYGELPQSVRQKVIDGATRHLESSVTKPVAVPVMVQNRDAGLTSREAFAWFTAAAAVVLLMTGWNPFAMPVTDRVIDNTPVAVAPTVEEQYLEFIDGDAADRVQVAWTATDEKSNAGGEVVWRDSSQEGFMVIEGLKPNNPAQSQYQLWIFDSNTGGKNPIDGGVFDIVAGETSVIPIDARIPVVGATMFAITEEKPGGVVVSDQKRLPLLAKVSP